MDCNGVRSTSVPRSIGPADGPDRVAGQASLLAGGILDSVAGTGVLGEVGLATGGGGSTITSHAESSWSFV